MEKEFQTWLQDLKENLEWRKMSAQIAVNLHYHLRTRGMTQKDFAELLGVSPAQVSKIMNGKENLGLSTIAKIQKVLGVNIIEIPDVPNQ